ncbi:protein ABHD18 [Ciona intestinalis]
MSMSRLDLIYRRLILTKFYTRGWGKPEEMKKLLKMQKLISNRETCVGLVAPDYKVNIDKKIEYKECTVLRGSFVTPAMNILPEVVPTVSQTARFEVVMPQKELHDGNTGVRPACIHMAGTGDHGFHRRRELLGKPLLESGITSVLLENPFYGSRKPKDQWRSGLLHVNDLFVMGSCLILEAQVLLHWLKRNGYGPLGLTGISMGGHMASLAATNWPEPLAVIPCMSWTSASVVWTEGVLSRAIPWRVLELEYAKNPVFEREIMQLINEVDSYTLGKEFAGDDGKLKRGNTLGKLPIMSQELDEKDKISREERRRQRETVKFMRGVMDQVTHLGNFSPLVDPTMATLVVARGDAYFPKSNLTSMATVWPGCQIREINSGHVAGCLIHTSAFNRAIIGTFSRIISKYHMTEPTNQSLVHKPATNLIKPRYDYSFSLKSFLRAFVIKA